MKLKVFTIIFVAFATMHNAYGAENAVKKTVIYVTVVHDPRELIAIPVDAPNGLKSTVGQLACATKTAWEATPNFSKKNDTKLANHIRATLLEAFKKSNGAAGYRLSYDSAGEYILHRQLPIRAISGFNRKEGTLFFLPVPSKKEESKNEAPAAE